MSNLNVLKSYVFLSEEKLKELLCLPEEVAFLEAKVNSEGIEFAVSSVNRIEPDELQSAYYIKSSQGINLSINGLGMIDSEKTNSKKTSYNILPSVGLTRQRTASLVELHLERLAEKIEEAASRGVKLAKLFVLDEDFGEVKKEIENSGYYLEVRDCLNGKMLIVSW